MVSLKVGESYLTESGKNTTITDAKVEVVEGKKTTLYSGQVGMEVKDTTWTEDGQLFDGKEGNGIISHVAKVSKPIDIAVTYEDAVAKEMVSRPTESGVVISGQLKVKEVKNGYIITLDGSTLIAANTAGVVDAVSNYITEKLTEPAHE